MPSKVKVRLTELLVSRGLCADEAQAERIVLGGGVLGNEVPLTQPGLLVDPGLNIRIRSRGRYVSRGGDKLSGALADFGFDPAGMHCLDVGASTGGFTDCLLQHGAGSVVSVDVAYGQFAWQLRADSRVILFERTNIREVDPEVIGAPFNLIVADLSFTSLCSILPVLVPMSSAGGALIMLVKPQFELPSSQTDKGIVLDRAAHVQAFKRVIDAAVTTGFAPQAATFSHITGAKGNIELFLFAQLGGIPVTIDIQRLVDRAHEELMI